MSLHQRKVVTNAYSRSRPKGEIGITWELLLIFWCETLWVEPLWIGEIIRPAMECVGSYHHRFQFMHQVITNLHIMQCYPCYCIGWWVETQCLFKYLQC